MAKKKYKITLKLIRTDSDTEATHVGDAGDAAKAHSVKAQDDSDLDGTKTGHRIPPSNGTSNVGDTIVWKVKGEVADVLAMCLRWSGAADTDSKGNPVSAFTPTVELQKLELE
jgi:hypothetical protein